MTRIAYLVTCAREITLADGTQHPTGYFAEEALTPCAPSVSVSHVVVGRHLITGQNPGSTEATAGAVIKKLRPPARQAA